MTSDEALDELHVHQSRARDVMARGMALLDGSGSGSRGDLRSEMAVVLQDYQVFKHERIFDPAMASGEAARMKLGRAMKIECIAAGEAFRTHQRRWTEEAIAADPQNYQAAARLTVNALYRHIDREREGITELLELLAQDERRVAGRRVAC